MLFLTSQSLKVEKKAMKRKISRQKKAMNKSASRMTNIKKERGQMESQLQYYRSVLKRKLAAATTLNATNHSLKGAFKANKVKCKILEKNIVEEEKKNKLLVEKNADLQHKINDLQQEILNLQIDVDILKMEKMK